MMMRVLRSVERWYSIPLLLVLWQAAVGSGLVESRLLPSLFRVCAVLVEDTMNGVLPYHAAITLGRAMTGFILAAIVGVPFAATMARSTLIRNLFEPIFFFGYPVPKIAFFPVFTYIFGIGSPSKIAFAFLECVYPIVVTAYLGFRAIPKSLIWAAENMGAEPSTITRRVVLPAAMPGIFTGLRIALPVSVIVVVLTEMIGDSRGLGYYIAVSGTRFQYAKVYAAILVIGMCGFVLDRGILMLREKSVHWERDETAINL
jgi:NitT/TauT family transport system permease protein